MAKATSGAAADAEFPIHWKEFHPKNFWQCIKACHSMISAVQKHANWIASLKGHLADRTSSGEASSSVKKTSKRDDTHRSTRGVLLEEISLEGLRKKGQNATWWKSSRTNPQLRMSHHRGSLIPCLGQNHFTAKSQDLEREYPARTTLAQRNPPRKKLGLLPVEDPRWPNRNSSGVQFPARTMQRVSDHCISKQVFTAHRPGDSRAENIMSFQHGCFSQCCRLEHRNSHKSGWPFQLVPGMPGRQSHSFN
ncbi:uncharacterized protein LOC103791347 isoform X2 [Callithrix jacchus]